MDNQPNEIKNKDTATRAMFGAAGAAPGIATAGSAGFIGGLLNKLIKRLQDKYPQKGGLPTGTTDEVGDLATRLLEAGKFPKDRHISINTLEDRPPGFTHDIRSKASRGGLPAFDSLDIKPGTPATVIGHEVGHATPQSLLAKINRRVSGHARSKPGLALPSLLALTGAFQGDSGETPSLSKLAPVLGGVQLASILGEESRANVSGAKLLKQIGHKMSVPSKIKMFAPTATYLRLAGALLGAPIGIQKGIEHYNKAKERGANPEIKQLLRSTPKAIAETPTVEELRAKWEPYFSNSNK